MCKTGALAVELWVRCVVQESNLPCQETPVLQTGCPPWATTQAVLICAPGARPLPRRGNPAPGATSESAGQAGANGRNRTSDTTFFKRVLLPD